MTITDLAIELLNIAAVYGTTLAAAALLLDASATERQAALALAEAA